MDLARANAIGWLRAVPTSDRVLLVRADALATPVTAWELDRRNVSARHPRIASRRHGPESIAESTVRAANCSAAADRSPAKSSMLVPAASRPVNRIIWRCRMSRRFVF